MSYSGKNFYRYRVVTTAEEMNNIIKTAIEDYCPLTYTCGIGGEYKSKAELKRKLDKKYEYFTSHNVIELKDTKLEFTTKWGPELLKVTTYIFDLNGEPMAAISGQKCFAEFSKFFKMPKAEDYQDPDLDRYYDKQAGKYRCSAAPEVNYNREFSGTELHNCYEYDLNSAYFNVLLHKIPDLNHYQKNDVVKENQVGFMLDEKLTMISKPGTFADCVFDLIDTPEGIKKYCDNWYSKKKKASETGNKEEKLLAKAYLNLPIGYSQRVNPFFRAYVVHSCNKLIKSLLDENSLFWNTDAIFSSTKRDDLEIGSGIGEFKVECCETLRYKGNVYQFGDNIPVYRGICKQWFRAFEKEHNRPYNILIDNPPDRCNLYTFDLDTFTVMEDKKWKR